MRSTGTVVVGADGSPESRTAIEFALRDAVRRGARLLVVAAAQLPEYWVGVYGMAAALPSPIELAEEARDTVRQELDEVRRAHPELSAVPVTVHAETGSPGHVLVDAAEDADVLVLGHRGRGGLRSALLGSVGLHCILHATCPVTIVRPTKVAEPVTTTEPALAGLQA